MLIKRWPTSTRSLVNNHCGTQSPGSRVVLAVPFPARWRQWLYTGRFRLQLRGQHRFHTGFLRVHSEYLTQEIALVNVDYGRSFGVFNRTQSPISNLVTKSPANVNYK